MSTIAALQQEWLSLQPLKAADQKRLDDKFKLDFNFNSNHLEGNTLTYGQTKLLLLFGETTGNASLKDYEEMKAHNVGLEMIKQAAADNSRPLTEAFMRELNKTILVQNYWKDARTPDGQPTRMEVKVGAYKSRSNSVITITAETFEYASPQETPALMADLMTWYQEESGKGILTPIQLATLLHYRYIRIHPFEDGNGRIARLLVNYVLLRNGYPMIVVASKDKDNYLRILHQCDVAVGLTPSEGAHAPIEQLQPFVKYMEALLVHSLKTSLKAAKGENIEEEDDFAKKITLIQRTLQQKKDQESQTIRFSPDAVWDVLEYCYFPLVERIQKGLEPAKQLFANMMTSNQVFKKADPFKGLHINEVMRNTNNSQILDYIRQAQTMQFRHKMSSPKAPQLQGLAIKIDFLILFNDDSYVVKAPTEKKYSYDEYPSETEITAIVSHYKEYVTKSIEEAIKK